MAQLPHPEEAEVVRELFERLRKGHSLKSIAADFGKRNIRTRTGLAWSAEHLRDVAIRPTYGGYRLHQPGGNGHHRGSMAGAVDATWPALVDRELFHSVRHMLMSPDRKTARPGRGIHLLSMIARCGVCSGPMTASYRRGYRAYECRAHGCVCIIADDLDGHAEDVMLTLLSQPKVSRQLRARPDADSELAKVRADLAEARSELAVLRTAGSTGKLTVATVLAMEPGLVPRFPLWCPWIRHHVPMKRCTGLGGGITRSNARTGPVGSWPRDSRLAAVCGVFWRAGEPQRSFVGSVPH